MLCTFVHRRHRLQQRVASGTYHLAQDDKTSTLVLKPDHSFQQELSEHGEVKRAAGTWRRLGEGGIVFSKEFLFVSGHEPSADGTAYADIHKDFGLLVSLILRQYHVESIRQEVQSFPSRVSPARMLETNPECRRH